MATQYDDLFGGTVPATVRHNNPGAVMKNGTMVTYPDVATGNAAMDKVLSGYGTQTLRQAIKTYSGNDNADAYVARIVKATGLDPDKPINFADPKVRQQIMPVMVNHEAGLPINPINEATKGQPNPVNVAASGSADGGRGVVNPPQQPQGPEVGVGEAGLRGLISGATLGLGNKAQALIRSAVPYHLEPGANGLPTFQKDAPGQYTYEQLRDEENAKNVAGFQQHPIATIAGNVVGGLPTLLGTGPISTAIRSAPITGSAAIGALHGAGQTGTDTGDVIENTIKGGAVGAAGGVVSKAVGGFAGWLKDKVGAKIAEKMTNQEVAAAKASYDQEVTAANKDIFKPMPAEPTVAPKPYQVGQPVTNAEGGKIVYPLPAIAGRKAAEQAMEGGFGIDAQQAAPSIIKNAAGDTGLDPVMGIIKQGLPKWAQAGTTLALGGVGEETGRYLGGLGAEELGVPKWMGQAAGGAVGGAIGGAGGYQGTKASPTAIPYLYPNTTAFVTNAPMAASGVASGIATTSTPAESTQYDDIFNDVDTRSGTQKLIDRMRAGISY